MDKLFLIHIRLEACFKYTHWFTLCSSSSLIPKDCSSCSVLMFTTLSHGDVKDMSVIMPFTGSTLEIKNLWLLPTWCRNRFDLQNLVPVRPYKAGYYDLHLLTCRKCQSLDFKHVIHLRPHFKLKFSQHFHIFYLSPINVPKGLLTNISQMIGSLRF